MPGMHQMNAAQPQSQMNSSQLQSQMNAAQHQSQMNATQPQRQMNSSQLQNQMNSSQLQRQMNAAQHQSQMNATQPQRQMNALPQGMRVYNPQLVSLPHNQMPRATVPPHPITNVEPVKPIGTPVPFYPIPEQRKQVSFLDTPQIRLISTEETVIQNLISGEEKDCQTTCSISKILQQ
jgi:hypothetical protein